MRYILLLITITFTTHIANCQQDNHKTVTAQRGDGIYKLLAKHGMSFKNHSKEFIELNKKNLGPDNSLYIGRKYKLPGIEETLTIPIFGKEYEKLTLKDNILDNTVFYLVSGHGGPDPGAVGKIGSNTLCEDEYAYDVTLRLGRCLLERGAKVYFITRDPDDGIRDEKYLKNSKDEVCYLNQKIPLNVNARLRQRASTVNRVNKKESSSKYRRCIAIHVDARSKNKNIDIFFYHHSRSKSGKKLAENMRNTIEHKYRVNQPNRGYNGSVSSRRLYMITRTDPTAVYVELGNINHQRDQKRIILEDNRQALANWMCDGIIKDYQNR
jgi:N-acetylmuramoyl-L-alanine amidase